MTPCSPVSPRREQMPKKPSILRDTPPTAMIWPDWLTAPVMARDNLSGTPESAGASGAADASAQEPYTVKLLIPGDAKTEDCAAVAEAASAILEEKYNTTLEITRIGFGSYPDQVNLMFSSGEKLDVLYNNRDIFISAINNG